MADGVAIFGAITGGLGLVLGVVNTWHNFGAESRKHQYGLRSDLAAYLSEVEAEIATVESAIRLGEDLPDEGPALNNVSKRLKPFLGELDPSFSFKIGMLAPELHGLNMEWGRVTHIQKIGKINKSEN